MATDLGTELKTARKVSVVVRAHNESAHLGRLLTGLKQQSVQADEIIVVDSGSTDDTVAIAEEAGCRIVHIPKELFSFGRSLNLGCEAATGDILLIVSAHVYPVYDTFLGNLIAPFDDERVSVAYGRQIGDDRTKYSEARIMLRWFPETSIWDQGHPFSNNANAAVLRSTWDSYRYDEDLTGLEDLEFANRVVADGGKVSYIAEAPVVHVHEETWAIIRNRYRREAIAYKKIMKQHKMSGGRALGLAVANVFGDYWHALRSRRLAANIVSIPRFRLAQFHGAWEGFRMSDEVGHQLLKRFYYPSQPTKAQSNTAIGRRLDYSGFSDHGA